MKTLFFCNLIPVKTGAFEALLAAIGTEFAKTGDEFVVVFGGEPIVPVAQSLQAAGVRWQVLPHWADGPGREHAWRFVLPAVGLVRRERPDVTVVHFGNELPTLAASLLTRLWGGRHTRWVWQQDQQIRDPGRLGRHLSRIRLLAAGVDHFVAVYQGGRQSLIKRGIPEARIAVIPNSIAPFEPPRAPGWLRRELALPSDVILLVATSSLIARKRVDFLVRACAGLPAGIAADWRLLIIGEGPEREALVAEARQLGVDQRVHFLGLRNDVRAILAEADVMIHAALSEAFSYAITESMAAGIPAVVTEAGAAREQIEDGRSGFVVARDDLEGFTSRVGVLMADPARRRLMGAAARQRWMAHFRLDVCAERYHRLYQELSPMGVPRVLHVVVSLAHGGLERLVVDWTNARNRRRPGSTWVVCLDEPGDLAPQVEGGCVCCLRADRTRAPWDRQAVARLKAWVRGERWMADGAGTAGTLNAQRPTPNAEVREFTPSAVLPPLSPLHHQPSTINHVSATVLHAHNLAAWQYAVLAGRGTGARTIYTQHGANVHNQRMRDRLRSRALAFMTDELVAVSEATATAMAHRQWIPRRRVKVIANGIEAEKFEGSGFRVQKGGGGRSGVGEPTVDAGNEGTSNIQRPTSNAEVDRSTGTSTPHGAASEPPARGTPCGADVPIRLDRGAIRRWIRDAFAIPAAATVIGSVGRLAQVKGYDRLIKALGSEGRESGVEAEINIDHRSPITIPPYLLLVGDGAERGPLEEQARSLGIADRVRFAGFQADPAPYLAAMDAFVLPSRSEGLSISLLEAMAARVPVFVTDAGASREVIDGGACGTVLPDSERDWMAIITAALAPGGRAADLLARAHNRVAERYSMDATLGMYEELYRECS